MDTTRHRAGRALLAALWLLWAPARAAVAPLPQQLAAIAETVRFVPTQALAALLRLDAQQRVAPVAERAEYLFLLGSARRGSGQTAQALATADELIALGRREHDDVALAKGLLDKAYVVFAMDDLKQAHQLAWQAERVANGAGGGDAALRIMAAIASGQSFAEDGNFPAALGKLQGAVALARQHGQPVQMVMALNALAYLYTQIKEYDKGFAVLAEALPLAEQTHSPGRMATLKDTEYALAIETGQQERGLKALLAGLAYERQIGADAMIATSLVNLSDSYLKRRDYARALAYATEAVEASRKVKREGNIATASLNIGQAYLGMGRLAEGKRYVESGLAWYDKAGDKPELQEVLMEYGAALERAGDMAGAVQAYHRERALSNELFEKRRQKETLELQEKYEAEDRQRQILLLQRENDIKSAEIYSRRLEQRVWWLLALVFALAAAIVGILYRKVHNANAQLKVKNQELKQQSVRDPLTALYNRRHFQEFMRAHLGEREQEARRADGAGEELVGALFLLDVDHFKHINDSYGHAAGDALLKAIADSLREILRETDMIVRWGGEEFLAFLPAIRRGGVDEVARRLLDGIAAHTIDYQGSALSVNVSIGFAPFPLVLGRQELSWERAVNLVDMALYLAKAHGRNRAYGVNGFASGEQMSMEEIEQDLELAWRAGFVDLSIVLGERSCQKAPVSALSAV